MGRQNTLAPQIKISATEVKKRVYSLRGCQVMLDRDLAEIYGIETKYLKRSVRSNIKRFPSDFMFELTQNESKNLRCNFCALKAESASGADESSPILRCNFCTLPYFRYLPFAFTEYGIGMLSSVVHSENAILVNIQIIRAFTELRGQSLAPQTSYLEPKIDSLASSFDAFRQKFELLAAQFENRQEPTRTQTEIEKVQIIQSTAANHWGLSTDDLKSSARSRPISLARHIAIYLMRKNLGMGFTEIGQHFGRRDHTTILHAYRKIHADFDDNYMVKNAVTSVQNAIQTMIV